MLLGQTADRHVLGPSLTVTGQPYLQSISLQSMASGTTVADTVSGEVIWGYGCPYTVGLTTPRHEV